MSIIIVILAVNWFVLESLWTKSKVKNGFNIYSVPMGLKLLLFVTVPTLIYGACVNWINKPAEKWVSVLLVIIALGLVYFLPSTILLSRDRAISIRWLGLNKTQMLFREGVTVYADPKDNTIVIQDERGKRIVHTIYNVDRAGFVEQLKASAGQSVNIQI
jgi:hypothetical protein